MNEGLFEKYSKVIKKRQSEKEEILTLLKEITGVLFNEDEIVIKNKIISFSVSSVKKTILLQKNIQPKFQEKGYIVKM
jgi:hypothetical protein